MPRLTRHMAHGSDQCSDTCIVCRCCAGPLMAAVNAQAASAMTTINFINTVGFDANHSAITVSFTYQSVNPDTGAQQNNTITVPFLTIVPIPYLQVRFAHLLLPGDLRS